MTLVQYGDVDLSATFEIALDINCLFSLFLIKSQTLRYQRSTDDCILSISQLLICKYFVSIERVKFTFFHVQKMIKDGGQAVLISIQKWQQLLLGAERYSNFGVKTLSRLVNFIDGLKLWQIPKMQEKMPIRFA